MENEINNMYINFHFPSNAHNVPWFTCMLLPRPVVPKSSHPATSETNRTHLVQWMHLVMTVLTRGPRFLSSTALLPVNSLSVNLERSDPKAMD